MTDPRRQPDDRPTNDSLGLLEGIQALQGEELPDDQDAVLEPHEIEGRRQPTRTELDQGDPITGPDDALDPAERLDGLATGGLREDETEDWGVASQEGIPWVPPTDPPIVPDRDAPDGVSVAAGLGVSADADPYDPDHRETDDVDGLDLTERIRAAIRADAATSELVDDVVIGTVGTRAVLRGTVLTIEDGDALVEVVGRVAGIDEVVDETELAE
jgi:hypothetical protein